MDFTIYCPSCGQKYDAETSFIGVEVICERCSHNFVVMPPGLNTPPPSTPVPEFKPVRNAPPPPSAVPEFKPVYNAKNPANHPPETSFALLAFRLANCIYLAGALFFLILTIANGIGNFAQIFYAIFILLLAAPGFALAEGLEKIDEIHYRQSLEKKEK